LHSFRRLIALISTLALGACGPHAHIPPLPVAPLSGSQVSAADSALAKSLAPFLYIQRDESFPLSRIVAVLHPFERVIAYHLLWRDDAHGAWLPFTIPTDEEIVWVGYDSTSQPTHVWTYWHGVVLSTEWHDKGQVAINVQWGKHGSMPRGLIESDLPLGFSLPSFFAYAWLGIPDLLLGKLVRKGPGCFCHGYGRYREFTRVLATGNRLNAIARTTDAHEVLEHVFGKPYSQKPPWPPGMLKHRGSQGQ
jgi:hypothetical protein